MINVMSWVFIGLLCFNGIVVVLRLVHTRGRI